MDSLLSTYVVMQQAEWSGRMFYQAQDLRLGQVVYLIAEPARGSIEPYGQMNLPPLEQAAMEGPIRWLAGDLTGGESLEDLRRAGTLTEQEILTALLSVIDGLASLSQLDPPVVPAYLDPSCIKRDQLGCWTLDYLALAQAPEARSPSTPPYGIYPFGVLLYWLATGQIARRTRVQVNRVTGISATLQFVLIRCLGRSYPSLAELRADVERAGREREFRSLERLIGEHAEPVPAVVAVPVVSPPPAPTGSDLPMELRRVTMGGPFIPADDRPWALPPRPADGFRKFVVPPEPDPRVRRAARWGLAAAASFALVAITGATLLRLGVIPALRPDPQPVVSAYPDLALSDGKVGSELPPDDSPLLPDKREVRERQPQPSEPAAAETPPAPAKQPTPPPSRPKPPAPRPPQQPAPATTPTPPTLQPGTTDYADAQLGGLPVLVHLDGRILGYAYMFPSSHSPYISLEAFNRLFGRNLFWAPHEGGQIRLLAGTRVVITADFSLVDDRVWLKLTTSLQEALGLQLQAFSAEGIYFSTVR